MKYYLIHSDELYHHGILGQKWGVRRYQNSDGTLTEAGRKRLERKDIRWARRNENRITRKVGKKVKRDMKKYEKKVLQKNYIKINSNGKVSKNYINAYNKKLAELMNEKVRDLEAPSGRIVRFVAKRGSIGTYIALADKGYDMAQIKNGVFETGKVAYKKKNVDMLKDK